MKELFEPIKMDSPRLAWIKKRDVKIVFNKDVQAGDEDEFSGEPLFPWCAFTGSNHFPRPDAGYGNTEHDAIVSLAIRKGWKLWNEE